MAENQSTSAAQSTVQAPVLRPGRAADPVPAPAASNAPESAPAPASQAADTVASNPEPDTSARPDKVATEEVGEGRSSGRPERVRAESRQRTLRLMLRQCDRVLLMDFELLAMNGWPDNFTIAEARRSRDLWLFSALIAAAIFLSGLSGFVPAWIAGGGFGAVVIIILLGVPAVRRIYTTKPSYLDLIMTRQRMLREARQHIAHLEGSDGLIWQCARMADHNPALKNTRFSHLLTLSENRVLSRQMTRREHVRLYLIYLLEAEKAYSRVQTAFFEGNQEAIDQGWDEVAAEPEVRA
ncbi:hypothetical protein [Marinobacter sp. F3R08]|uniref:hypothetical protein n=1 Tax=Marinobacter sp. F3R08 TaxID=2841559 RepID=UPI001C084955|nr:hypothetical protein [Marinobacter sp. F3R08]MBU2955300.1 hypothetical protein [Marinobacter sp. F3R08]